MPEKRSKTYNYKPRLHTVDQVNDEIRKLIRAYKNKTITASEYKTQIDGLTKLRAGMPDPVEQAAFTPATIIVRSIAEGQGYAPGKVLLPYELLDACWKAYRAGPKAWEEYLVSVKGLLTQESFDNLSAEAAPEKSKQHSDEDDARDNVAPLRLLEPPTPATSQTAAERYAHLSLEELKALAGVD